MSLLSTKDNVCEVSSTKGVASFILGGAIKGSQSFATAYPSGGPVYYYAREFTLTKEVGIMWEIGIGTLTGGALSRDTVISSSAGTSKVQFPGPVTQIYSIVPLSTLVTDINAIAIDIAASIHSAPNKATPVGADEIGIWDSVTQLLGKVSFTNLATYFAGLCSAGWNAATATLATTATTATTATNAVNLTGSGTVSATTTGGAGLTPNNANSAATVTAVVASGATGTTQAIGTNNTTMATTAYADTHVPKDMGSDVVGEVFLMSNSVGSPPTIAANATIAGSQLVWTNYSGSTLAIGGPAARGTWRNIGAVTVNAADCGFFQRIV